MVKTVVSIHRRGPFSAIVQSESMSYSSIVDRQREDENDVDDERDERNETRDQRFFFIFGPDARITLLYRVTPSLCPDTNRTLATARPARLPARDATGALPPPWRTACPRPWHPWRRLRRRRRRPLPRQTIFRTPFCVSTTCMCLLRRRTEVRVTPTLR